MMSGDMTGYQGYYAWKAWGEPFAFNDQDARYYRSELGRDPAGMTILEIGFGSGSFLGWARSRGASVSGAELGEESVAAAQRIGIPLVSPDFEATALAPGTFDAVVAFDVFEHIDSAHIPAKLRAIADSLKPGGMLIMRYPNGQSPYGLYSQHGDATHVVALSRAKIEQYAAGSGLRTTRYGASPTPRSGDPVRDAVRGARALLRSVHARLIRFVYAIEVELAPVVSHVMVRDGSGS